MNGKTKSKLHAVINDQENNVLDNCIRTKFSNPIINTLHLKETRIELEVTSRKGKIKSNIYAFVNDTIKDWNFNRFSHRNEGTMN